MADSSASSRPLEPPTVAEITQTFSQILWKIQELEGTLAAYDPHAHGDLLEQRLAQYQKLLWDAKDMIKLVPRPGLDDSPEQLANTLDGRKAPEGLLRALDAGVNPDEFLRDMFLASKRDNQISKGKCEALKTLSDHMLAEASQLLPNEAKEYKNLLGQ